MDETRTLDPGGEPGARAPRRVCYLVVAFDCARPTSSVTRLVLDETRVHLGRGERRDAQRVTKGGATELHVELPDAWMSSEHARLVSDAADFRLEDLSSKNGTWVNGARVERASLRDGDVIEVGNTLLVYRALLHAGPATDHVATPGERTADMPQTASPLWSAELETLHRLARGNVSILLLGETGSGKEVLARALHAASGRKGPFTPVNCGAVAEGIFATELFGSRRGAFTGATEDREGLVRASDGGTLFLDEIAELSEASQVALLRVLQEREVLPVGATKAVPVDLRVVAATNVDLGARVAARGYREDLYARLAGHVARVPALRERREDVGLLVAELLRRLAPGRHERITIARAAARALFSYAWPLNVRELENALRVALAAATGDEIGLADLPEILRTPTAEVVARVAPVAERRVGEPENAEGAERERIVAALEACAGNQTKAAKMLGWSRATLVTKLSIHRIPRPRSR